LGIHPTQNNLSLWKAPVGCPEKPGCGLPVIPGCFFLVNHPEVVLSLDILFFGIWLITDNGFG
jgi:hypothetical protein